MFDFDNVLQTNKVYRILTTNNYVVFVAGEDSSRYSDKVTVVIYFLAAKDFFAFCHGHEKIKGFLGYQLISLDRLVMIFYRVHLDGYCNVS